MVADREHPQSERAASIPLERRKLTHRRAVAVTAGVLAAGLLAIAVNQRITRPFVGDEHTLNHPFVRAAEEAIRRLLGFAGRVSEVRLDRSKASLTLRAVILIADGGVVNLQINLDRPEAVERTGVLQARNIQVRRDSIAGDVLQKAEGRKAPPGSEQHVAWPKHFRFESIQLSFSIGHGQLVIEDAVLSGHPANVTLRGKVDLRTQTITVFGTYLPLSNLPSVPMPTLLTGPHGDGLFGVRFAIQGHLAKPDVVIVNPMWLVPPGMLRKIFETQAQEETKQ